MTAYEDLKKELKASSASVDESPLFGEYGPWLGKMTGDTNAGALDAALDTAFVYVELASSSSTTIDNNNNKGKNSNSSGSAGLVRTHASTEQVFVNVIDKALSSIKSTTVAKGKVTLSSTHII